MYSGRTVFSQLIDFVSPYEFRKCVERYGGDHRVRSFACWDQFLTMAFAQLTYRQSLRDIESCLRSLGPKLYHAGIRATVSRTTLADANEKRDWRIYADFARLLIAKARRLYADEQLAAELRQAVYALDATNVDLCLSLFPWATFRKRYGGMKVHTLFDLQTNLPTLVVVTHANVYETRILDRLVFEPGAIYVMDRGYTDWTRLHRIHRAAAFFVIRAKKNLRFRRVYSRGVDRSTGLECDQTVVLCGGDAHRTYPDHLRRVRYFDAAKGKHLVFLTNNFQLPALTIAHLYRRRWQIELFFRWIKQHLRIKAFYGTSPNAVKTQVWIAICVYVLVAIVKKHLKLDHSLYTILQILSLTLFEKTPISQVFSQTDHTNTPHDGCEQLDLFDF